MGQSKFLETMSELGYVLEEQEGKKLTFKKNVKYSTLVLVVNLGDKYVNPILLPSSVVLYESDLEDMIKEFQELRQDADTLYRLSNGTMKILN